MKSSVDFETLYWLCVLRFLRFCVFLVVLVETEGAFPDLLVVELFIVAVLQVACVRLDHQAYFRVCLVGLHLIHFVYFLGLLLLGGVGCYGL